MTAIKHKFNGVDSRSPNKNTDGVALYFQSPKPNKPCTEITTHSVNTVVPLAPRYKTVNNALNMRHLISIQTVLSKITAPVSDGEMNYSCTPLKRLD